MVGKPSQFVLEAISSQASCQLGSKASPSVMSQAAKAAMPDLHSMNSGSHRAAALVLCGQWQLRCCAGRILVSEALVIEDLVSAPPLPCCCQPSLFSDQVHVISCTT